MATVLFFVLGMGDVCGEAAGAVKIRARAVKITAGAVKITAGAVKITARARGIPSELVL